MTKVVPAILEQSVSDYRKKVALVRQLTDRFQLDVIDGEYVDNRTLQPQELEPPSGLKLDIHLMVARPNEYIGHCLKLRPHTIIVQFEGPGSVEAVQPVLERIAGQGIRAGLAINPETELATIEPLLGLIKHLLCMAYPAGFAGQKLHPAVLKRAAEIRELAPALEIGLDGGLDESTAKKIAAAGFDIVNTNSYLFGAESPLSRYHELMGVFAV